MEGTTIPRPLQISIIIPTFNRAGHVEAAIRSALDQMTPADELIVVDDGSQDRTLEVLNRFGGRLRVLRTDHCGAGRARNLGVREAKSELVAFLDSDDTWLPGKLQIQRAFMEARPDVLFSFTNFEVERRDGSIQSRYLDLWNRDRTSWEEAFGPGYRFSSVAQLPEGVPDFRVYEGDLYRLQLTGFYVLTDTLVVRRREAGGALHFAEDLSTYEDLECFYRLAREGKGALLDIETARQLDHPHDRLSQMDSLAKIDARLTLLRRIWGRDSAFLAHHQDLYRRTLDALLDQKAGVHILLGQNRHARKALAEMSSPPVHLRILSRLPSVLTLSAISARRVLRAKARSR